MDAGTVEATLRLRDEMTAKLKQAGTDLRDFGSKALGAGTALTAGVTLPILAVGAAAIKMGIDAVESKNLVDVSFGDMAKSAHDWAAALSASLGLNRYEMAKGAGEIFNMTTSMGLGRQAAFDMSTGIMELSADMASFRNIPMEEALAKIRAGLVGEAEPLKRLGILVDENTVKTEAYRVGIAKQGEELSNQQKVLARWSAILKQTSNDQGDLARTITSPANQLRVMRSRIEEAATSLGVALMPMISQVTSFLSAMVPYIQKAVEWFAAMPTSVKLVTVGFLGLVAAAGPILMLIGGISMGIAAIIPILPAAAAGIFTLSGAMGALGKSVAVVAAAMAGWEFGKWLGEASGLTDWVGKKLAGALYGVSEADYEASSAARQHAESMKGEGAAAVDSQKTIEEKMKALLDEANAQGAAAAKTAEKEAADKAAKQAAEAHRKAVKDLHDELSGNTAIADAKRMLEALPPVHQLNKEAIDRVYASMEAAIGAYQRQGQVAPEAIRRTHSELHALVEKQKMAVLVAEAHSVVSAHYEQVRREAFAKSNEAMKSGLEKWTALSRQTTDMLMEQQHDSLEQRLAMVDLEFTRRREDLDRQSPLYRQHLEEINKQQTIAAQNTRKVWQQELKELESTPNTVGNMMLRHLGKLPELLRSALTGGGGISGGIKAMFSGFGEDIGTKLGEGLFNKTSTWIGNTFGTNIMTSMASMIPGIGGAIGSLLGPLIGKVGGFFKGLFGDSESEKKAKEALKQVQDMRAEYLKTEGGLEALTERARVAGVTLTAMLNAKDPEAYKKAIEDLNNALKFQDDAMRTLDATIQKYKFSIDELGPAWGQQKLHEQAMILLQDYEVLKAGGIEHNLILEKMAPNLQEYVSMALKAGLTVPENMRPILQAMVDLGLLTDEGGEKMSDLSKLTFAETLDAKFKTLIESIQKLVEAITRGVGGALDDLAKTQVPPIRIPYRYEREKGDENLPDMDTPTHSYTGGTGGMFKDFGTGTLAVLHGRERVQTEAEAAHGGNAAAVDMYSKLDSIEDLLRRLPTMIQTSMRDGILLAH